MGAEKGNFHLPVMANEIIGYLNIVPGGAYVDMTLGDGGHSAMMLKRLSKGGRLIAFDRDEQAIIRAEARLKEIGGDFTLVNEDFAKVSDALMELGVSEVNGFIFDLGVSSQQLDDAKRGFSFSKEAKLDMRMDRRQELDAFHLVNELSFGELHKIIKEYGEERFAKRIASRIVSHRATQKITTTKALADIVSSAIPRKLHPKRIHAATKTFQALRVRVNDELGALQKGLDDAISHLSKSGRICVISFNSLEDRIVKRTFVEGTVKCECPKEVMYCRCEREPYLKIITRKPQTPSAQEVSQNPRARSAKLRIAERI